MESVKKVGIVENRGKGWRSLEGGRNGGRWQKMVKNGRKQGEWKGMENVGSSIVWWGSSEKGWRLCYGGKVGSGEE